MATFTPNYGLHQWVPEDQFLRTDFNEDFQKIDAAIKAAENKATSGDEQVSTAVQAAQSTADRALAGLEPLSYNVYNLLLQNYYDGKSTQYKKALLFDGFQDKSGIASMTGIVWDAARPSLLLDAVGQQQDSVAFGVDFTYMMQKNSQVGLDWTATGNGILTKVESYIQGSGTLVILQDKQELYSTPIAQGQLKGIATATVNVTVTAGVTYRIELRSGDTQIAVSVRNSEYNFGARLSFTPKTLTSGSMTTTGVAPGMTAQRAVAWVRHLNGTASLSLQTGGSWTSMSRTGTRTTVNLDGESCTESTFTLNRSLSGNLALQFSFSTSLGKSVRVFDYGVALI